MTSPGHDQCEKIFHKVIFCREQTDEVEVETNVETENKIVEDKSPRLFHFKILENDFMVMVDNAFQQISEGLIGEHKFPSQLTTEQIKVTHERAAWSGLLAVTKGTKH